MRKRSAAAKGIDLPNLDDGEEATLPVSHDDEASPRSTRDTKFAQFANVAEAFKAFRPASEVLTSVRAVPTIFPQFDHATKVGGLPIERFTLLHGPSAGGKALGVATPVLTPHGWKPIGEIVVGDDVISVDGTPTKVEGVYPQGDLSLYRVDFNDGSHVECCADHLWYTTTVHERVKGRYVRGKRPERVRIPTGVDGEGSVKSLAEIIEGFEPNDHAIPIVEPVEFVPLGHLPIDPYMLGLILGDGGITEGQVKFHKPEKDLQEAFIALLPDGDTGIVFDEGAGVRVNGNAMKRLLMGLDLWGCRSWEKTIPDLYMRASKEDRLALLRGLFDTDGTVPKNRGAVEFTSTSFKLAEQVTELARSLGGFVAVADARQTRYPYAGEVRTGRTSFRLRVSMPKGVVPVSSKKHLARWRPDLVGERLRTIVGIALVRIGPAVCIRVAHPRRLFVMKDFIVTHNTYVTIAMMLSFLMRDHPVFFVDAERTTPITWLNKAMPGMSEHPLFRADKPTSYEKVRADVRNFCLIVKRMRDEGKLAKDTSALIVVDSIRKLVPQGEWERIMKEIKAGADGESLKNRSAQTKAAMNATWMDEITPLLDETGAAMIVIARETEDPDAPPPRGRPGFGTPQKAVKVGGGKALFYDASLDLRSERVRSYGKEVAGKFVSYGDVHKLTITKSKVSGKEQYSASCLFHISNGGLVPQGFDLARDVVEFARTLDVIEGTGWLKFGRAKWQGVDIAVKKLSANPALLAEIDAACRAVSASKRAEESKR